MFCLRFLTLSFEGLKISNCPFSCSSPVEYSVLKWQSAKILLLNLILSFDLIEVALSEFEFDMIMS